jgi:hypothetical protein
LGNREEVVAEVVVALDVNDPDLVQQRESSNRASSIVDEEVDRDRIEERNDLRECRTTDGSVRLARVEVDAGRKRERHE